MNHSSKTLITTFDPIITQHISFVVLWSYFMLAMTIIFWVSDLDVWVASLFFHTNHSETAWPGGQYWFSLLLYERVNVINQVFIGVAALLFLIALLDRKKGQFKIYSVISVLALALGPGLLINFIFKENMERPRPVQIENFGGPFKYQPLLIPGKSDQQNNIKKRGFPCGHCSSSYLFYMYYFIFRRRKQFKLAMFWAAVATGFGLIMGVTRMAAGAHFLSDVLWSGYIMLMICWLIDKIAYQSLKFPNFFRVEEQEV